MNIVSFQKIRDPFCDLAFEIVEDDQGWGVSFEVLPRSRYVWYDDVLDILEHDLLVRPVLGRMSYVPIRWEFEAGVTAVGFALIDDLNRKEISH